MTAADRLYRQIVARAAQGSQDRRTPAPGPDRTGGATGLDTPASTTPCEVCPSGWATADLFRPGGPVEGVPACARCAESARRRHATYRHLGPVLYRHNDAY